MDRYQFNNIFNGDYDLAVELDSVEIARMSDPYISEFSRTGQAGSGVQVEARPEVGGGVVFAADTYTRRSQNRGLYQKASQEIESKNLLRPTPFVRSSRQIRKTTRPGASSAWSTSFKRILKPRRLVTWRDYREG